MANITGTNKNDVLNGTSGADVIDGLFGKDTMIGGLGGDTYYVDNAGDKVIETQTAANGGGYDTVFSSVSYALGKNVEELDLTGSADINAAGNGLNNFLVGNGGRNVLDGGAGADFMVGGAGNDTYHVDNLSDLVVEGQTADIDTVYSTVALTNAFNNVENYNFLGVKGTLNFTANALDNFITGGKGNDVIDGGDGNDVIDGGKGADHMTGGTGNDVFIVDNAGDLVTEQAGGGNHDMVKAWVSTQLADFVEDGQLLGTGAINMTGNGLSNIIWGNAGANVIDGGGADDSMSGGKGNDTYIVDSTNDDVFEKAGEGIDLVKSSADFSLSANVENIILTGNGNIVAWGNDLKNVMIGNDGNNTLDGGKGADTLIGGKGDDTYVVDNAGDKVIETVANTAGGGTDLVIGSISVSLAGLANVENVTLIGSTDINATGNALDNELAGNAGANVLDGGKGADHMFGMGGDDTYYVDNVGDVVNEVSIGGHDTIISSIAFTNTVQYVEDYRFNIKTALTFTGDAADNEIWGGSGNDTIKGGGGNDTLHGGAGDDYLEGAGMNDVLDGGAGADMMVGALGDDTYFVDNAKDVVNELPAGGTDTVYSTVSIASLWGDVENVVLQGKAAINVVGNFLQNDIKGNGGANVIDGGGNADTMAGGKGNDTYIVDNAGDKVLENANEGIDTVKSAISYALAANVENLVLTGAGSIDGTGNALKNVIVGNDGANTLDGGTGADIMIGGKGNDIFIVDNAGDKVVETLSFQAGGGHDWVKSSVSFSLAGLINVEDLSLTGTADLHATGNARDNHIDGNSGDNLIDGGKGGDIMEGNLGNDTYIVDSLNDFVDENPMEGTDTIISTVALTQSRANVENYIFKTAAAVNFVGNALDNDIYGGSGKDHIKGGGGHDYINGNGGNDWLEGGALNDLIDGGSGADKMEGHADNDTYYVNNAGDKVVEQMGEGFDTVYSTVSITHLFDNVEGLWLGGKSNINGIGNDLDNIIYGNSGNNVISGGGGKDEIYGQHGNDLLIGGAGADQFDFVLKDSDGHDTVKDFLKAEDVLEFGVGDVNKDGKVDLADLVADVKSVVDHGAGKAVDVHFTNGAEITFGGCGVGGVNAVHSIQQLVADPATQIHVS